jgi:hypothetical protein
MPFIVSRNRSCASSLGLVVSKYGRGTEESEGEFIVGFLINPCGFSGMRSYPSSRNEKHSCEIRNPEKLPLKESLKV